MLLAIVHKLDKGLSECDVPRSLTGGVMNSGWAVDEIENLERVLTTTLERN
jgi:hypothetical protein